MDGARSSSSSLLLSLKGNDVSDIVGASKQHHELIHTQRDPTVWRCPIAECIEQESVPSRLSASDRPRSLNIFS